MKIGKNTKTIQRDPERFGLSLVVLSSYLAHEWQEDVPVAMLFQAVCRWPLAASPLASLCLSGWLLPEKRFTKQKLIKVLTPEATPKRGKALHHETSDSHWSPQNVTAKNFILPPPGFSPGVGNKPKKRKFT